MKDIDSSKKREQELAVQQLVMDAYKSIIVGEKNYSQKEAMEIIDKILLEQNAF